MPNGRLPAPERLPAGAARIRVVIQRDISRKENFSSITYPSGNGMEGLEVALIDVGHNRKGDIDTAVCIAVDGNLLYPVRHAPHDSVTIATVRSCAQYLPRHGALPRITHCILIVQNTDRISHRGDRHFSALGKATIPIADTSRALPLPGRGADVIIWRACFVSSGTACIRSAVAASSTENRAAAEPSEAVSVDRSASSVTSEASTASAALGWIPVLSGNSIQRKSR
jgi:hypothetical protein